MDGTRRRVLTLGAGALAAGLAGCSDSLNEGGAPDVADGSAGAEATASFFTLYDFARNVGGDAFDVENAVPEGQHGHGWEPRSDVTAEIVEREAFVYLGIEGFQRWVDEVVSEIEANHDVATVDAAEGVDLVEYGNHDHRDQHDEYGDDHQDDHDHGHGGDHEGGGYDPHFWVDPVRARQSVETIRDRLIEIDGDNADAYEENAASYLATLEDLHERYETELADRDHDVVVVAGHDSYSYLGDRYGFEIHTPQGVSPDAEPNPGEIADTVDLVEGEGIEYVLYDYFEGDDLARTVAEEAGGEVDTAPLSPAESITGEWESEGLDYVGQMEEVNLPSLREALGAGK